jgi:FkbM family methyltransferase
MCLHSAVGHVLFSFRRLLDKVPFSRRFTHRAAVFVRSAFPEWRGWLKVERGFAKGLWFRLHLPAEWSYWLGYHEPVVQDILQRLCKPGSVFYDVGAHLGFFSFAVANAVGPEGKVYAFEPDPENCLRFKETAIRNKLERRVQLVEAAIWSYTAPGVPFRRGSRGTAQGGVASDGIVPVLANGALTSVPTVTLDHFVRQGNLVPAVIKIDVEGGECKVLEGSEEVFARSKPILICEVHRAEAAQWIADWLSVRGYAASWRIPEESFPRLLVVEALQDGHAS